MNNIWKLVSIIIITIFFYTYIYRQTEHFKNICGKLNLNRVNIWKNIKQRYGEEVATQMFPKTYILPDEIDNLLKDPNKQFILKKTWSSYRKGCKLFDNKDEMKKKHKKYNIAQIYIKNPYLINGFKFDIRIFMAVYCGKGVYLYREGYNDYTKKKFDYNSMDRKQKINHTYPSNKDNEHYEKNNLPKFVNDIGNMDNMWETLADNLKKILDSNEQLCCSADEEKYNIYGLDVELLENLNPIIIEINSSPGKDLGWKDDFMKKIYKQVINGDFTDPKWIKIM